MDEALLKRKYYYLKNRVLIIRDKHRRLQTSYDQLRTSMKNSLQINDRIVNEDKMNSVRDRCNSNINEITSVVLPRINRKL